MVIETAVKLWTTDWYGGHLKRCTAIVSVFMASHILSERRPLALVVQAARAVWMPNMSDDHARHVYRLVHPYREQIIPDDLPAEIAKRGGNVGFAAFLPTPEGEEWNAPLETSIRDHGDTDLRSNWPELVDDSCTRLGWPQDGCVPAISRLLTRDIAYVLHISPHSRVLTATAIFMATYLVGTQHNPTAEIADAVGVTAQELRSMYHKVYPHRHGVIHHRMVREIGRTDLQSALQAVPPLEWPRL